MECFIEFVLLGLAHVIRFPVQALISMLYKDQLPKQSYESHCFLLLYCSASFSNGTVFAQTDLPYGSFPVEKSLGETATHFG